jgi:2'-5' RNA ligase
LRLFFALWPPPAAARALAQWALEAQRATGGKATAEEQIHLTLAFVGEADPGKALAAARRVRGRPHRLPIETAKVWKRSGVAWAGPREAPVELIELFTQLKASLADEGIELERRPFAAHVTLMRKARPALLPPLPAVDWPVAEFLLMRSSLSSAGPSYEALERFALR